MKQGWIIVALALCWTTEATAGAKVRFYGYEGPNAVQTGEGGTKLNANGIDYWTSGTPPRRYQTLGMITDQRYEEWGDGHAVGSAKIAKEVLKMGGNAVIVMDANDKNLGSIGTGSGFSNGGSAWGSLFSAGMDRTTTRLLVVKYLD